MIVAATWGVRHQEFLHVWIPILVGLAFLALVVVLYRLVSGSWKLAYLAEGADQRLSTSKFQVLLWTIVVVFGYVVVETSRFMNGEFDALDHIPPNVLIALGFTLGTATLAKGITTSFVASGRIRKGTDPAAGLKALVTDDSGAPDLSKWQLLTWTLIALVVYVVRVMYELRLQKPVLPDIDAPLMILMGLGQGAYVGKKLTTTTVTRLSGIDPAAATPGQTSVTVTGSALGGGDAGTQVTLDGAPTAVGDRSQWDDDKVVFTLPADRHPNGQPWRDGQRVAVGVTAGGRESANTLPLTVTVPSAAPAQPAQPAQPDG